ncbi:N-acetylglucosamine-6-phosphate deacetylase [Victivallis vadensis]|uniref:N-acetylglucosamine-6-phosphate deacetylase n=1 Tax=Victivallis vadensis TaxID=172901 RepID=A0A848B418_9BACT|nr:N-acetylglucosamine-6-phosphate deacetylase [Victivallis vadensis]NMD88947.1 N-acetylglucosamine-6-phosphate deacetylase [Victivallis vadensis]
MKTLIKNCRLVSPDLDLADASILIEAGKIAGIFTASSLPAADRTVDAAGLTAMPGFVDVHCHGRNNFDFCDALVDGVNTIAREKLAEGVTTLLPTTLTLPEADLAATLKSVAAYDGRGCKLPGVHLEGPFINPKCTGAQNPAFVRKPDVEEVKRLNAIYPVLKVSFAVEEEGGDRLCEELRNLGITPSCVHSAANYSQFKAGYAKGLRNLSHFCNQMTPLHHRDIGLVGAGLLNDGVFIEFICDKLHISPDMIALVFKVKDAGHIQLISDAMRASGMPNGEYTLGGLPVIVQGGAARLKEGGALAGSTLQIMDALRNVAEITSLPLKELVKSTSFAQAQALGLPGIGKLEPGYQADIVLLTREFKVSKTLVDGEIRYEA